MALEPIVTTARDLDLSSRVVRSTTVVGSPAAAAETTVASLTVTENITAVAGIELTAWAAFTVGTNGVTANLKIHQTNAAGSTIVATGLLTVVATNLVTISAHGFDTAPVLPGQIYIATLTIGSGSAASTVSAVYLRALVV